MPYRVSQGAGSCSGYAVVVTTTGRVVGCHPSRARAERHLRALYANVPEAREKAGLPAALAVDGLDSWAALLADDAFWARYERQVSRAAAPLLTATYMAGVVAALRLPEIERRLGGPVDTSTIKRQEPKQLKLPLKVPAARSHYGLPTATQLRREGEAAVKGAMKEWASDLSATTKKALINAIAHAQREGLGADYVAKVMQPYFGDARAQRIAVTEVTRWFTAGAMETYQRLGIEFWVWQTVEDGKVCAECEAFSKQSQDDPFPVSSGSGPPGHTLCRCFPRPATAEEARRAAPIITPWGELARSLPIEDKLRWIEDEMSSETRVAFGSRTAYLTALENRLIGERIIRRELASHWADIGPFERGGSVDEMLNFMKVKHPWIDWSDFHRATYIHPVTGEVLANKLDRELMEGLLERMDELALRFPDTMVRLRTVGLSLPDMPRWDQGTYAATTLTGREIGYNPAYLNHPAVFRNAIEQNGLVGFHPRGADYPFIVSHEFGHALDASYGARSSYRFVTDSRRLLKDEYDEIVRSTANTTEYGKKDHFEHFAQGFAEWYMGYPTESAAEFEAFFNSIGSGDNWLVSRD